jgi:hypothetical protein
MNCLYFLNQIEDELGIKNTVARCAKSHKRYPKEGVWLFIGSKRWMKSPPMISLFALLIRVGFSHRIGENFRNTIYDICENERDTYSKVDKFRLRTAKCGINRILMYGDRKIFHRNIKDNFPNSIDIHYMHNKMGISGYSTNATKDKMPHWHRL